MLLDVSFFVAFARSLRFLPYIESGLLFAEGAATVGGQSAVLDIEQFEAGPAEDTAQGELFVFGGYF